MAIAFRLYLVPKVGAGTSMDPYRPKYLDSHFAGLSAGGMDFGVEPVYLIGVKDIPDAVDIAVRAESDVTALPVDLTQQIGTALTATRNALENLNIPGNWIQATTTFTTVVRTVAGLFQFLQRLNGITTTRLFQSRTLATKFNQLPTDLQTAMIDAATSLGYNTTGLTGNTILRTILKNLADQWGDKPLIIGGVSI